MIDDFFETITLYDQRAVSAQARKRPDGRFDVDLVVAAKKVRADGAGNEKEAPLDMRVDIGVQDAKGDFLVPREAARDVGREPLHHRGGGHAGAGPASIR